MLRAALTALLFALIATPAAAQHWATADACRITDPKVHESVFGPNRAFIDAVAANEINGTGRLWKITAPNGAVSHLWGTYHSNDPTILDLPPQLRAVLADAKTVASEFNPIPPSRRQLERRYSDDRLWGSHRSAQNFSLPNKEVEGWIRSRMVALGYGRGTVDALSGLGLAEALLGDPCNDFNSGIFPIQDDRVLLLGADAGAQITGLEPPDALRDTLSRADRADTTRALIEVYGAYLNPNNAKAVRETSFALYLSGDIATMRAWDTAYILGIYGDDRGAELIALVDGYLVVERNQTFLQSALPLVRDGGAVLAVGSFHLPGPSGLVALLRDAGMVVERVVTDGEIP